MGKLAFIAPITIYVEQRGYIKGRQIYDCIIVALQAINVLRKICFAGNLAMKINVKKAFDTQHWSFSLVLLAQLGFVTFFSARTRKYYTLQINRL